MHTEQSGLPSALNPRVPRSSASRARALEGPACPQEEGNSLTPEPFLMSAPRVPGRQWQAQPT